MARGETYLKKTVGKLRVESVDFSRGYRRYQCTCLVCGESCNFRPGDVTKHAPYGCIACTKKAKGEQKLRDLHEKFVGKVFGELEIEDLALRRPPEGGRTVPMAQCLCHRCGRRKDIPLSRITQGGAKTCGCKTPGNLEVGQKIRKGYAVGGSLACALVGRKGNRNSSTGHTGVSQMKGGRFRAYITFRRKQYHLGTYSRIEDAVDARKEAEAKIYGDFLDWYRETYPDRWERLSKK